MQAAETMRDRLFTMRMSTEEAERADRVAKHFGLNVAGVIRMLLKREDDSIRNDAAMLATHGVGDEKRGRIVSRMARTSVEEATGASFACPSFFRGAIRQAAQGGANTYEHAGQTLTHHFRDLVRDSDEATAELEKLIDKPEAESAKRWVRTYLPRCYELVPPKKLEVFVRGVLEAIDRGDV